MPFRGILFVLLLGSLLIDLSCESTPSGKHPNRLEPAFYYWKTDLKLGKKEKACLDGTSSDRIYLKILDIGRNEKTKLITIFSNLSVTDSTILAGKKVIPCIFLTNSIFEGMSVSEMQWLMPRIQYTITNLANILNEGKPWDEIQLDCDWTESTRDQFFFMIGETRKIIPKSTKVSATIRLHQYKFPEETGVPPVDRGMLMMYNTGNIEDWEEDNSILALDDVKKYVKGAPDPYRIQLDLALPVFSWGLVYRDGELWKILPAIDENELKEEEFFEANAPKDGSWTVKEATIREGHYLRPGDIIRFEEVSEKKLKSLMKLSKNVTLAPDARLAFFHLDDELADRYPVEFLKSLCGGQ